MARCQNIWLKARRASPSHDGNQQDASHESGASSDFFELSKNGNLESVAQIKENDGIWGYLDGDTFVSVNSTNMSAPIPDQFTIILLAKDDIKADLGFSKNFKGVTSGFFIRQRGE